MAGGGELWFGRDVDPLSTPFLFPNLPFSMGGCVSVPGFDLSLLPTCGVGPLCLPSSSSDPSAIVRVHPSNGKERKHPIRPIHPSMVSPHPCSSLIPTPWDEHRPIHTFRRLNRPRAPQDACDLRLPIGEERDKQRKNNERNEEDAKKERRKKNKTRGRKRNEGERTKP